MNYFTKLQSRYTLSENSGQTKSRQSMIHHFNSPRLLLFQIQETVESKLKLVLSFNSKNHKATTYFMSSTLIHNYSRESYLIINKIKCLRCWLRWLKALPVQPSLHIKHKLIIRKIMLPFLHSQFLITMEE